MRFRLITVSRIGALVIDLDHHTRANRASVGLVPVALGRDVPALAAAFTDAGDYASGAAVDRVVAEVRTAGIGEVVGCGETGATGSWFRCQYCRLEMGAPSLKDLCGVIPFKKSVDSRSWPKMTERLSKCLLVACCRWATGDSGAAVWVPGERGGKDRIGVELGGCGLKGGDEEEEEGLEE